MDLIRCRNYKALPSAINHFQSTANPQSRNLSSIVLKYILTIILLLTCEFSFADWLYYYIDMDCDQNNSVATFIPSAIYDIEKNQQTVECNLKDGTKIKSKLGTGRIYPYGNGGADPEKWFSVWINEAKVISRQGIGCSYEGPCSMYFSVSRKALNICSLKIDYKNDYIKSPVIPNDFECQAIPFKHIGKDKDFVEYPRSGAKQPLVGSVNVFYARNSEFCNQFIVDRKYRLPDNLTFKFEDQKRVEKFAGIIGRINADLNNDGVNDDVYALQSETHNNDGDSYFIFDKENNISSIWPNVDVELIDASKKYVFPNQWASCSNENGCKYDEYDYLTLLAPDPASLRLPILQSRYIRAVPFALRGEVYFSISSMGDYDGHLTAILKPLPKGNVEHMCYFNQVQENY